MTNDTKTKATTTPATSGAKTRSMELFDAAVKVRDELDLIEPPISIEERRLYDAAWAFIRQEIHNVKEAK